MKKTINFILVFTLSISIPMLFAKDEYTPPKIESDSIRPHSKEVRNPASINRPNDEGNYYGEDLMTLDEIRGEKKLKEPHFWKFEIMD